MSKPRHLLVFRLSAMGDVAMTVPVIRLLLQQYPDLRVTFVSNGFFQPLFANIERLTFYTASLKERHKGLGGLYQLYKDLKKDSSFDAVADLHNVLRTQVIRKFFLLSGKTVEIIDKGRKEKKELTRKKNKILRQLPTTFERYAAVFDKLGYPVNLNVQLEPSSIGGDAAGSLIEFKKQGYEVIGVAPFAQHPEKMYPAEKMKELLRLLSQRGDVKILLFGGQQEASVLEKWKNEIPAVINMAGKISFQEELQHISLLDLMVSMDSANMHLASLFSVPVVSIWGGTHPFAGFYGWRQPIENAVQTDLYCRPCSVFGNKTCYRGDLACLQQLSPLTVYQKIIAVLNLR